eukprot:75844_1
MPRRKRNKRKDHKKHKQNKSEISTNSNLKQVICSFLRNIFKPGVNKTAQIHVISELLINYPSSNSKLTTEQVAEMIKSQCTDPKIDSRKIDYYIEIITSTKDINGTMESIPECIAIKLFEASLKPKRLSYIDDCAKWCLEFTKSYPQIMLHFEVACKSFDKNHFEDLLGMTQLYKCQSKTNKYVTHKIICYLKFIGQLFKDNLISSPRVYDTLRKCHLINNQIFHLEMLYIIGKKCGKELYCEGNWNLLNVISDTYDKCTRCSICQHLPMKPMHTPCGHIFCSECISNAIRYQEQTSICPYCGPPFCGAPCDFKELQSSLTLPHIQEILKMRIDSYWLKQLHYDVILSPSIRNNNKHRNQNQNEINESKTKSSEINQLKAQNQAMQESYNDLEKKIKDMKTKQYNKLQSKQTEIDKLQLKCKDFEILLQKHKSTTNAEIKQLQFEKKEKDHNYNQLSKTFRHQAFVCRDLERKTKKFDSLITDKQVEIDKLSLKCKKSEKSSQKSISKQNKLKAKYNDLEKKIKDMKLIDSNKWNNKLQSKQTEIDKLQLKCKDFEILLQKHKSTTNAEIKQLQFEKKEKDHNYNQLSKTFRHQAFVCRDLERKTKKFDSLITDKQVEIDKLSLKCKKSEKSSQKSISKQNKLKAKYNELKTNHQRVITEHKSNQYEIQQLKIAYNELEIKHNEQHKKFSYLSWNSSEIANWILNMDKLRYKKYH